MEGKDLFLLYKEANSDNMASLEVYIDGDFQQNVHANSPDGWNNAEVALVLNDLTTGLHEVELGIKDTDVYKNFAILGLGTTGEIFSVKPMTAEQIPYTDRAILNVGNTYRINQVMERARAGEDITIGFIGGSITMGSGASFPDKCYAKLVFDWWVANFPKANFTFVNAGIGATTSQFACARVEDDLLSKKPDFVVIEFSVNDESTEKYAETYESLLRTILTSETAPGVLVLNMVQYNNGQNAQNRHNTIAMAYDLPIISMKESIYNEILFGNLAASDISADNLHPNDKGHAYAAEIVTNYLGLVNGKTYEVETSYEVPETSNQLSSMTSKRYDNRNSSPELNGFTADTVVQNNITEVFSNGYKAKNVEDFITFKVTGSNISLQYRKTNTLGAPYAIAIIDGDEANAIELDGNYPNGWGDWLYLHDIATNLENKEHTVEIRITEAGQKDFYLVSVISTE
jgi:lysophospholipase L1-like esterase